MTPFEENLIDVAVYMDKHYTEGKYYAAHGRLYEDAKNTCFNEFAAIIRKDNIVLSYIDGVVLIPKRYAPGISFWGVTDYEYKPRETEKGIKL